MILAKATKGEILQCERNFCAFESMHVFLKLKISV